MRIRQLRLRRTRHGTVHRHRCCWICGYRMNGRGRRTRHVARRRARVCLGYRVCGMRRVFWVRRILRFSRIRIRCGWTCRLSGLSGLYSLRFCRCCRRRLRPVCDGGPKLRFGLGIEWTAGVLGENLLLGFERHGFRRRSDMRHHRMRGSLRGRYGRARIRIHAEDAGFRRRYRSGGGEGSGLDRACRDCHGRLRDWLGVCQGAGGNGRYRAAHILIRVMNVLDIVVDDGRVVIRDVVVVGYGGDVGDVSIRYVYLLEIISAHSVCGYVRLTPAEREPANASAAAERQAYAEVRTADPTPRAQAHIQVAQPRPGPGPTPKIRRC